MILKDRFFVKEKVVINKIVLDFYKEVNQFLLSEKIIVIISIFEGEFVVRKNVIFKVICEIREKVLEIVVEVIKKKVYDKLDIGEVFVEFLGGWGEI